MSNTLSLFLAALGEQPSLRLALAERFAETVAAAGLNAEQRQALSCGDAAKIYCAAGAGHAEPPKLISLPRALAA